MASRKKSIKNIIEKEPIEIEEKDILTEEETKKLEPEEIIEVKAPIVKIKPVKNINKNINKDKNTEEKTGPKYKIGSIVYISKDADADLNGFKLFPQYKKYTYTVEAYDDNTGVYSLRRLNLSLRLKETDIVAPHEKSSSPLIRRQF